MTRNCQAGSVKEQHTFHAQHAASGIHPDRRSVLRPMAVFKLGNEPEQYGRGAVWQRSGSSRRIAPPVEVSIEARPEAAEVATKTLRFLDMPGVNPYGDQQIKPCAAPRVRHLALRSSMTKGSHRRSRLVGRHRT
jgi:hypothetical protein